MLEKVGGNQWNGSISGYELAVTIIRHDADF